MKIGLLTLNLHTNYGGILQAYALKAVLKRMGHEVYLISSNENLSNWDIIRLKIKKALGPLINDAYQGVEIEKFVKSNFQQKYEIKRNTQECFLDAIIVGSDQVWRSWSENWNTAYYFLDFAEKWNVKKLTYAVSFGFNYFHSSNEADLYKCKKMVKQFTLPLAVREKDGVSICKSTFNVSAVQVLDPTLLLDANEYEFYKEGIIARGDFVTFILDPDHCKNSIIDQARCFLGDKSVAANGLNTCFKYGVKCEVKNSVETWFNTIAHANFVITDSFHGTALSINFNRPFVVLANAERGQSRISSILELFELEDRLVSSFDEVKEAFNKEIDWQNVNKIKEKLKVESLSYISRAILNV